MRVSAVDLRAGDVLSRGDVVSLCVPVDLGFLKGWARMGNIERAAIVAFTDKPQAHLVIDRIFFDVVRKE